MWSPTHVQVTVCRAKGLLTKGKNGTNDVFVTIAVEKEKFQTSVKQKASPNVDWQEECELAIPSQGNTAEIVLTVLHQNFIGVDEFLGLVALPLSSFDVYERPRARWYPLRSKQGQENKTKYRGELEVRVAFTVKSGSLLDLSKKDKLRGSFGHISHAANSIGGSLMSLGSKEKKGIKKLASSMGHKLKLPTRGRSMREDKSDGRFSRQSSGRLSDKYSSGEPDPGVISEDEDEFRFDELSHKSSGSSLNLAGSQASGSLENLGGELIRHNSMNRGGTLPGRLISPSLNSQTKQSPSIEFQSTGQSAKHKATPKEENEWNQKLFGTKPNHVSKEEELASSSIDSGVPSIIIQDSFILEEDVPPPLPPSMDSKRQIVGSQSQSSKKKSPENANTKDMARQNKATNEKTGEQDVLSVFSETSVPFVSVDSLLSSESSFPKSAEPVKHSYDASKSCMQNPFEISESRSQNPFDTSAENPFDTSKHSTHNPFDVSIHSAQNPFDIAESYPQNPFDVSESPEQNDSNTPNPESLTVDDCKESRVVVVPCNQEPNHESKQSLVISVGNPFFEIVQETPGQEPSDPAPEKSTNWDSHNMNHGKTEVLNVSQKSDDALKEENQVCQLLEKAIEGHDVDHSTDPIAGYANSVHFVIVNEKVDYMYHKDKPAERNVVVDEVSTNVKENTVEPDDDYVMELTCPDEDSPVLKSLVYVDYHTPANEILHKERLSSLFYTPHSEIEENNVIELKCSETDSSKESEGFVGSETLSPVLPALSQKDSIPSVDSAIPEEPVIDLLETKKITPKESLILKSTPSDVSTKSTASKMDLSWDNYDIQNSNWAPISINLLSVKEVDNEANETRKSKKKRVSLSPALRTLDLDYPSNDSGSELGSPTKEQAVDHHRTKMASSFHQRVVVGEEMAADQSRDSHFNGNLTSSNKATRDVRHQYQSRSREELINLLEDRDQQLKDLKEYIDTLLARVIDTCPTLLQKPYVGEKSPLKKK